MQILSSISISTELLFRFIVVALYFALAYIYVAAITRDKLYVEKSLIVTLFICGASLVGKPTKYASFVLAFIVIMNLINILFPDKKNAKTYFLIQTAILLLTDELMMFKVIPDIANQMNVINQEIFMDVCAYIQDMWILIILVIFFEKSFIRTLNDYKNIQLFARIFLLLLEVVGIIVLAVQIFLTIHG